MREILGAGIPIGGLPLCGWPACGLPGQEIPTILPAVVRTPESLGLDSRRWLGDFGRRPAIAYLVYRYESVCVQSGLITEGRTVVRFHREEEAEFLEEVLPALKMVGWL